MVVCLNINANSHQAQKASLTLLACNYRRSKGSYRMLTYIYLHYLTFGRILSKYMGKILLLKIRCEYKTDRGKYIATPGLFYTSRFFDEGFTINTFPVIISKTFLAITKLIDKRRPILVQCQLPIPRRTKKTAN